MPPEPSIKTAASPAFILLGEDDIDDEELLKDIFRTINQSLSLFFINNGRKVLATLQQLPEKELPCLIVLDYNMPEMNGAEILEQLKKDQRYDAVPKIIWSTSGSETYKKLCLGLGACDYLIKPSSVKELTEAARYMLSFCR